MAEHEFGVCEALSAANLAAPAKKKREEVEAEMKHAEKLEHTYPNFADADVPSANVPRLGTGADLVLCRSSATAEGFGT